jgi:hypothetical protein
VAEAQAQAAGEGRLNRTFESGRLLVGLLGAMQFGLGIRTSASRGCACGAVAFERRAPLASRAAACELVGAEEVADRRTMVSALNGGTGCQ